jgi:2-polyprenyl-3-methyl-5-hydroxy-6-metoxy-1,4-benzoquinol methylase
MTWIDRWIQKQRINRVLPYIPDNSCVLDIGCFRGELFEAIGDRLWRGYGLDPLLSENIRRPRYTLTNGRFPDDWNDKTSLDCITLLAVLEHIPLNYQEQIIKRIFDILKPGGLVILTVPSKKTDNILNFLKRIRIIDGMSLEEHFGFDPRETKPLFEKAGFVQVKHKMFQLRLNNLFVFKKVG